MIISIKILVPKEAAMATGMARTEGEGAVDRIMGARTSPLEAVALGPLATLKTLSKKILDEAKTPEVAVASNRTGNLRGGLTTCNLMKIAIKVVTSQGHTFKTTTPGLVSGRDSLAVRTVALPTTTLKAREGGSSIIRTVGTLKYLSASSRTQMSLTSRFTRRSLKMRNTWFLDFSKDLFAMRTRLTTLTLHILRRLRDTNQKRGCQYNAKMTNLTRRTAKRR
jgi:hypothetical protein